MSFTSLSLEYKSILSEYDQVRVLLDDVKDQSVIMCVVSETWLRDDTSNAEITIPGYKLFRKDRPAASRGGWILIYVREDLKVMRRFDLEPCDLEVIWIELKTKEGRFLVSSIYRPPNERSDWFVSFSQMLENVSLQGMSILLTGDFNLDLLNSYDKNSSEFGSILCEHNLTQLIKVPTRITQTSATLIDHIFTDDPDLVKCSGVKDVGLSDHSLIYCFLTVRSPLRNHHYIPIRSF